MVDHEIVIKGVDLQGNTCDKPALLQMNHEDFPKRFLDDLAKMQHPAAQLSSVQTLSGTAASPALLFQPVQRILHVATVQLACDTLQRPRLDPMRVESAGIVIRRLRRNPNGVGFDPNKPYQAWIKTADGRFQWKALKEDHEDCADPDPKLRPALKSGQPWLDTQLAASTLAQAAAEVFTPAFLAPPDTNAALGRTIAYAVIPAASSDISDATPGKPVYDSAALAKSLPNLISFTPGPPQPPAKGASVDYRWLSEDYAANQSGSSGFSIFVTALLMLYRQFNAFDGSPESKAILDILDRRNVTFSPSGQPSYTQPKGQFFSDAYAALIDFDPASGGYKTQPMPDSWDPVTQSDQDDLLAAMKAALLKLGPSVQPPEGRYQDPSRQYVARVFFRVKGHTPACPSEIHWSCYSEIFKIAAWYDSTQRSTAPIPLPDPSLRSFLKGAKPNVSFAVPDGLMAAMQGTTLKSLAAGQKGGPKLGLNWICGFNIPLITICAFFVLNIFLVLLNLVFFWLPFIKICIPIPTVAPASGDDNG